MTLIERIAQAMADYENEHRYELESGSQSTGVEPYEVGPGDFEEIATFIAERLQGAVSLLREAHELDGFFELSPEWHKRVAAFLNGENERT